MIEERKKDEKKDEKNYPPPQGRNDKTNKRIGRKNFDDLM